MIIKKYIKNKKKKFFFFFFFFFVQEKLNKVFFLLNKITIKKYLTIYTIYDIDFSIFNNNNNNKCML